MSAAAKAVMDGIVKTQRMLWEQEGAYTALRGGLSDEERNVRTLRGSSCTQQTVPLPHASHPSRGGWHVLSPQVNRGYTVGCAEH